MATDAEAKHVSLPKKIQRLEEAVVNRIAAGEVIQRPANAIKEMVENCLDAGSTSIQVGVKSGGLKLIQIQDNGCGIKKEDMHIVCERFTTSKLREFEDLSSISTYGFRGEALASISHVAHVTITTRTQDSKCAYKACYSDGKLIPLNPRAQAEPKPCAGNQGTLIVIEDLFYNVTTRRKALKSPSEEYSKIADVMSKYAVHNAGVAFTLKKLGETMADVRTQSNSTTKDNISSIYGASVARELLSVSCENGKLGFKMEGFVTNANYSTKRLIFLLFINHRLVDSLAIRKAIEAVYTSYLPKNSHPFVSLSIEIVPSSVDVNVHPTKHEVHFLHEDVIVETIQKAVEECLLGCNSSRTYFTQALLPGAPVPVSLEGGPRLTQAGTPQTREKSVYDYQLVRTDCREQKMDAFLKPASLRVEGAAGGEDVRGRGEGRGGAEEEEEEVGVDEEEGREDQEEGGSGEEGMVTCGSLSREGGGGEGEMESRESEAVRRKRPHPTTEEDMQTETYTHQQPYPKVSEPSRSKGRPQPHKRREVRLTSVRGLQQELREDQHRDLTELFQNHKFVGCVDQTRALVQHQTRLYLVDVARTSQELFYQLILLDFANFGTLRLMPPAPIYDLALLALNMPDSGWTQEDGPKEKLAQCIVDFLKTKHEMLKEYFAMEISEDSGCIHSLPMLLDSYSPNLDRLPMFVLRLSTEVEWESESECFQTFARECSSFYSIQHDPFLIDSSERERLHQDKEGEGGDPSRHSSDAKSSSLYKRQPWKWIVEHVLFPALRLDFTPPRKMAEDGSVLQIADLHDLYKVFERC